MSSRAGSRCLIAWCSMVSYTVRRVAVDVSKWDRRFDESIIDGFVNSIGQKTFAIGRSLRVVQTGRLRQYVMFIAGGLFGVLMLVHLLCSDANGIGHFSNTRV